MWWLFSVLALCGVLAALYVATEPYQPEHKDDLYD